MQPPKVVGWYRVYAGAMTFLYLLLIGLGLFLLLSPNALIDPDAGMLSNRPADETEALILGAVYSGLGLVLAATYAVSFFLPRRRGSWIYGIVLIAIGMTSCLCLPATIPLLIHWLKPECRDWFHAADESAAAA